MLFEEKGQVLDLSSINSKIMSLKGDIIMWMEGLLIVTSGFLFTILNQRITDVKDFLEKDIAENKVLIQKILDNQNKANIRSN